MPDTFQPNLIARIKPGIISACYKDEWGKHRLRPRDGYKLQNGEEVKAAGYECANCHDYIIGKIIVTLT